MGRGRPKGQGRTPGSGRAPGTPNRSTIDLQILSEELGIHPFKILLLYAAGDWKALGYKSETFIEYGKEHANERLFISPEVRMKAASDASQYLYPKRKPVDPMEVKPQPPGAAPTPVSFAEFCKKAGYPEPYPKQIEMMEFIIHRSEPRLLLGARSYGKTIFSTICGVAYQIYRDATFTCLITTKVEKNGRRILKEISRTLQANGIELEVDNADEIRIKGLVGKEASVMIIPLGSSGFRSLHPKIILFEDPVVPGSVSEADREQVKTVYNEAMKLCSNVAVIGQPVDFRDMYQYLRNIIETLEVPYGSIPELDQDLDLYRASGMDEKSIQASFFLKIDTEDSATFSGIERIEKFPTQDSVGFIDPADGGDYTAFGVFTQHFQGMAIVGQAWKKAWNLCIPEIKEMCRKYRVKKLGFEVNKFGVFPLQVLREELASLGVSVEGKYTHSNKEIRIQLAAQFSKSLYLSKESNSEYTRQVTEYSPDAKHDDSPDTIATFLEWAGRIRPPKAMKKPSGDL